MEASSRRKMQSLPAPGMPMPVLDPVPRRHPSRTSLEPCAFISARGSPPRRHATPNYDSTRSEAVSGKGRREVVAVVAVVRSCVHVGADTALITPEIS